MGFGSVLIHNPVTNAKITGLKNSNSKVIEVTASEDDMYPHLEIKLVGEGTTKISFQYAGKTLTQKITVRKYKNPCKLLKIGKTNYAKCFNKSGHYNHNKRTKNVTGKITIKPKKGWKLKTMYSNDHYRDSKKSKYVMTKDKKLKNGSSVKIQKGYTSVKIDVQNPKGEVYRYLIILNRKTNVKAAGAQSEPEIYITELGQVYDAD